MIHREATPCKFLAYPPYAVSAFVFLEDTLDFRGYICISLLNFICFPNLIYVDLDSFIAESRYFKAYPSSRSSLTSAAFSP